MSYWLLKEMMPGIAVPLLAAAASMVLAPFLQPLRYFTMSALRWLFLWAALGLVIPSLILLIYPWNTDAALHATSSRVLWPSSIMLMAADPYTPPAGIAIVIAMSISANVFVYSGIAFLVWIVRHVALNQRGLDFD